MQIKDTNYDDEYVKKSDPVSNEKIKHVRVDQILWYGKVIQEKPETDGEWNTEKNNSTRERKWHLPMQHVGNVDFNQSQLGFRRVCISIIKQWLGFVVGQSWHV